MRFTYWRFLSSFYTVFPGTSDIKKLFDFSIGELQDEHKQVGILEHAWVF